MMHLPINVKSPNNTSKWQMGFNSAFKGLMTHIEGRRQVCETDVARVRVGQVTTGQNYCSDLVIIYLPAYEDGTDSVPERRHMKFTRQGITQKKTYNGAMVLSLK
jgi:hypothetical protein